MTRLAATLLVAVLCADLGGFDCSRLAVESGFGASAACCSGPNSESPDCFCCSVADETVHMPPCGGVAQIGPTCLATPAAAIDGVRPVPYRPPLSPSLLSVL
jgi:hypothetical protein